MDDEALEILHRILAMRGRFGHREHLELAWTCLDRWGVDAAHAAVGAAIGHLARRHGMPRRYHETLTRSWVHLVAVHRAMSTGASFDEFIAVNGGLLEADLLSRHYSRPLLDSEIARSRWAEPDLRAFPALA